VVATSLLVTGCGTSASNTVTLELTGDTTLDGAVRSNGTVLAGVDKSNISTGDIDGDEPGVGSRQFFSFILSAIPVGAVAIESARLQVKQEDADGDPFPTHGPVVVDHLVYGDTLDASDYSASALTAALGPFSTERSNGLRNLDVTAQVKADLVAGRTRSQFRLRFSLLDSDNNGRTERVHFRDADNSEAATPPPVLVVTYRVSTGSLH
jgi:hypothetical protein